MKPTEKSPEIDSFLKEALGVQRRESIEQNVCAICHATVDENSFKDSLSLKEYRISGMCQDCQDKVFG